MKIVHTMASEANAKHRTRRFYSPELKSQIVAECQTQGASVAGVALSHGINANIVHRWLREHDGTAHLTGHALGAAIVGISFRLGAGDTAAASTDAPMAAAP